MKKIWMGGRKKSCKPLELFLLHYWMSMLITIAQSFDRGVVVFPSKDSKWKGKVDQVRNMLIDAKSKKLYFAATNKVFMTSSDLKTDIQVEEWNASDASKKSCKKRKKEDQCENFITILEFDFKNDVFACGTNALQPACVTFNGDTLKKPDQVIDGYRQHSPRTGDGTVVTLFVDPYLFIGMREHQEQGKLFKLKPYKKQILATTKESKIFDEFHPDFVSAYAYDNYAYFFLREYGYESQKRQVRYSRVARVCKHDSGVSNYGLNKFITLLKTRLQCNQNTNGLTDLFYDELQSTYELVLKNPALSKTENTYIYGIFSIASDLSFGTAICRFSVTEIQRVFATSFLYRKEKSDQMSKAPFSPLRTKITRSACNSSTIKIDMKELKELGGFGPQLLYDDVKPSDNRAIFSVQGVSFTSIVAIELISEDSSSNDIVIFTGTSKGFVYKILIVNQGEGKILGKPFQPFKNSEPITSLKTMDNMIYAASFGGIASFRVDRCDVYDDHCKDCVADPYCQWSTSENKCSNVDAVSSSGQLADVETKIERICPKTTVAAPSVVASSTSQAQVTTIQVTTTEATTTSKTKIVTSDEPYIKTESSSNGGNQSYYTEFIIMAILFGLILLVLILVLLMLLLLRVTKSRHINRSNSDDSDTETKKGCHKFCPASFSKAYLINKDQSNKKLMKGNPIYRDMTVELNDVGNNGRHNIKVS